MKAECQGVIDNFVSMKQDNYVIKRNNIRPVQFTNLKAKFYMNRVQKIICSLIINYLINMIFFQKLK